MPAGDRSSPMRFLTVSAFFETHGGGVEIVAGALASALAKRGHDSRITGAAFDPLPSDAAVSPVPLSCRDPIEKHLGLPMPLPDAAARAELKSEIAAADAVIIHDALYASSVLAARTAQKLGKPWALVQHIGHIPYSSPVLRAALGTANRMVTRRMLASAGQAFFISDVVRQHFKSVRYRRQPMLMFNGVDSSLFHPPAISGDAASADLRPELLFVGRFVEKKGLAALHALARLRPHCDLAMVGSGPIDPETWKLPNVHVLGRKTRAELAELYRSKDALILPSMGEGYPLVVQEAMATGLPVLCGLDSAAADPGAADYLSGVEVAPKDPALTAQRFSAALNNRTPRRSTTAAAYAARTYDWDANARTLEETFASMSA